jgi:SAM-dependent methyltransferase
MNLVDLINFRNTLQAGVPLDALTQEFNKVITRYYDVAEGVDSELQTAVLSSAEHFSTLKNQLTQWHPQIQETIDKLNVLIREQSQKFFSASYALELEYSKSDSYLENLTTNLRTLRHWRNIRINDSNSPDVHMLGVIQKHVTFEYPVLEIGCRDGDWTKYLVAGDPLYLAEYTEEFLHNAVNQFTRQYVPRVRQYLVKDNKIDNLPQNQFGFIFSYNFFNYLAFGTIKEWMIQVHNWLRPGGSIIFTYNNADLGYGAGMAESGTQSYCPYSMLVPMCESIGLEYVDHKDYVADVGYNPFSWVQFKKPGELSTVKVGQALGEIKYYSAT